LTAKPLVGSSLRQLWNAERYWLGTVGRGVDGADEPVLDGGPPARWPNPKAFDATLAGTPLLSRQDTNRARAAAKLPPAAGAVVVVEGWEAVFDEPPQAARTASRDRSPNDGAKPRLGRGRCPSRQRQAAVFTP
jgi:hypothetical protein